LNCSLEIQLFPVATTAVVFAATFHSSVDVTVKTLTSLLHVHVWRFCFVYC